VNGARVPRSARARGALLAARARRATLIRDLSRLVAIPSVSGTPGHRDDLEASARWLARRLRTAGLPHVRLIRSGGPPVVHASTLRPDRSRRSGSLPTRPHVLVYAHYDVQPADARRWTSPPFRLTRAAPYVLGRGTADDKGPLLAHISAFEALQAGCGLPVDVTYLFEGEEEIGSPHFPRALRMLGGGTDTPDVAIVSDTRILGPDRPALVRSLRGSLSLHFSVHAPFPPLHVGMWAGAVHNPALALAEVLSSLHDAHGRVLVPGFYDRVAPRRGRHPECEPRGWARWGVPGFSSEERTTVLPALTVTHLRAGGQTVAVPNCAEARINVRHVPGQDLNQVQRALTAHLMAATPRALTPRVELIAKAPAVETPLEHSGVCVAAHAYQAAFGRPPEITRSGGTIGAAAFLQEVLRAPVVLMGFTLPDANIHAPDERLHLPTLWRAVDTVVWFLLGYGTPDIFPMSMQCSNLCSSKNRLNG
jgi:acetylornithine deacetylase/succinyl-diaminopimelate desuccinylase-like protein